MPIPMDMMFRQATPMADPGDLRAMIGGALRNTMVHGITARRRTIPARSTAAVADGVMAQRVQH